MTVGNKYVWLARDFGHGSNVLVYSKKPTQHAASGIYRGGNHQGLLWDADFAQAFFGITLAPGECKRCKWPQPMDEA